MNTNYGLFYPTQVQVTYSLSFGQTAAKLINKANTACLMVKVGFIFKNSKTTVIWPRSGLCFAGHIS